ncbi:MAG: gliding motility-associated C-terminal domain-containing protein [Ferruginibacter sp.]
MAYFFCRLANKWHSFKSVSILILILLFAAPAWAQVDNCSTAGIITIPNSGFGLGTYNSSIDDISTATVQTGEAFAPAILVAGQTQKSIWYKFTIPTNRSVKVTLAQNGSAIQAGDAGFAVYKTNACLPTNAQISTKLTPIGVFGSTFHPCVEPGDYLIQVSSKASANGPVYITVELAQPTAAYDKQTTAYQFGTLSGPGNYTKSVDYAVDCQTIEDATEVCTSLYNYQLYNKSTWHTFTTPAYFDYIGVMLSGTGASSYFTTSTQYEKFGYNLYAGDARTLPFSSLTLVDGCDTLMSNGYYADRRIYKCSQLQPNTTYSIQLFFKQDFYNNIRLAVAFDGTAPTQAPEPIAALVPASNKLGALASSIGGVTTTVTDQLGCNSRHSLHPCAALPSAGFHYSYNNYDYNLSTFFTFTLTGSSRLNISAADFSPPYRFYSTPLLMKLYKQDIGANCAALDTSASNLVYPPFLSNVGFSLDCVPAGTYTLQVMGRDSVLPLTNYYYGYLSGYPSYSMALLSDLGKKFTLSINVANRKATNNFDLKVTGAYDTINRVAGVMQPMVNGVTYLSRVDTFGCADAVRPIDTSCLAGNTKAIYRQMMVPDSGILAVISNTLYSKLYWGDADALSTAQNVHSYPQRITGLNAVSLCLPWTGECGGMKVCVTPGTYTNVTFGGSPQIGQTNQPSYLFYKLATIHDSPANAENIGTLNAGSTITSGQDYFSCKDNAIPINGYIPCPIAGDTATKAIYREFYLNTASTLAINNYGTTCGYGYGGFMTLFSGRISAGVGGLVLGPPAFRCFQSASSNGTCVVFDPGWYTIVSYGSGPTYQNQFQNLNQFGYSSYVGFSSSVSVSAVAGCPGPKYNRPYKAAVDSVTHQPFLIEWGPRTGNTSAYPRTDTLINLYTDNFNCTVDTPFTQHHIISCVNGVVKVSYYVFRTTQDSYVQINTKNLWAAVYKGDARTDSASFDSSTMIQPCIQSSGFIQLCRLQPGSYTLVIFGRSSDNCTPVIPAIYIDKIGYSRFDFANKAYDFGMVPPDSLYHSGKVGDVNPLDAGRAASNDFFYCTTGASPNNPTQPVCNTVYNDRIYKDTINNYLFNTNPGQSARRNLWYSFVVKEGGNIHVKVLNKTIGKQYQYRFAVYKSNVDGTLPFTSVVSAGQVDSTAAQGLTFIVQNPTYYYCYNSTSEVSFYRDPCSAVPERYYVLVENTNAYPDDYSGMQPNSQAEVSILVDSVNAIQPKFDHHYQASSIGTNIGTGTYVGATDNFSCATKDAPDPVYNNYSCATKTLWYKFTTYVTGHVKFREVVDNASLYSWTDISLYKETIPGDSTINGLQFMNGSNTSIYDSPTAAYWGIQCIQPGTYYFMLSGCSRVNEYVHPEIKIVEEAGDFCSAAIPANLTGAGTALASAIIDCHTIGTDYGEFNPTLTCPAGAVKSDYKTSWFKINITGTDTLDVTTFITENTNALPSEIKYRLMNGNCGAMQERSCVQDAQTQDTYKCLAPGEYFIQVFTPVLKNGVSVTGTIDLHLSAVHHADTCAPPPSCLANATFIPQFDCNTSDSAIFVNYSTYGSAIQYSWDFGYAGQTSNAVAPKFKYPELSTSATYTVSLTVLNTGCTGTGNTANYISTITIPGRPKVNLGNDTTLCTPGSSIKLHATTWPGSTYLWQNGTTDSVLTVTTSGQYYVRVTYNGCIKRDTINVYINTIIPYSQTKIFCGNDSVQLSSLRNLGETYLWNTGSTASSIYASSTGVYLDHINWKGCLMTDSFKVTAAQPAFVHDDTTVCFPLQPFLLNATAVGAQSYQWQNNSTAPTFNVTAPGQYSVKVTYPTCVINDTIQVHVSPAASTNTSIAAICAGQTYTLPWGTVVSTAGVYRDTIRSAVGCDSIRSVVNLAVQTVVLSNINAGICAGQNYTLPWGTIVNTPGIYLDTLHYVGGCDSIRRTVNLSVQSAIVQTSNASICAGQTYTLANGTIVNSSGIYSDTLHYIAGCDSLRRTVNLTVQNPTAIGSNASICAGQTYTLPWGTTVNTTGIYRDTLHYATGCDSVRRAVNLTVQNFTTANSTANICAGQNYTLPWGTVVNTAGVYRDTLHYATGCDSVRKAVTVTLNNAVNSTASATICAGQNYTLPWGTVVNTSGVYQDTLHYLTGCDSIRRTVNLFVQNPTAIAANASICAGQTYTLPWGAVVNTTGTYRDTLHYTTGCDSVRRAVNLTVQNFSVLNSTANICAGQNYTLPWGTVVSTAGVYRDTLRYVTGCDSVRKSVTITLNTASATSVNASICAGQNYTLPWGAVVNTAGVYQDTLHYLTGCDSLRRTVNLTVQNSATNITTASICAGQNYILPGGGTANATGVYRDTLHYSTGCDSIRRVVNLTVLNYAVITTGANICAGQNYTLPSGVVVNTPGTYRDTLHYTGGCDSIRRAVTLTVQNPAASSTTSSICAGQNYTLPWGTVVNTAGTYNDTLHYITGCDSLRRTVNLTVQSSATANSSATICAGQNYTLPSGVVVYTSGIYRDTLHYVTGCDSIRRAVNLTVTAAALNSTTASICSDQTYTLPWGSVVNTTGIYRDTIKTTAGCDSVIRNINLTVRTQPFITVTKSNDVNCILSTTKLNAYGASTYVWSPTTSLSDAFISNPIASPDKTTLYKVTGTAANGCTAQGSIEVKLLIGNLQDGYLVPNSFTPNNDGLNDCFGVPYWGAVTNFKMTVFSRWGEILFESSNSNNCWDGTYKGKRQDQGAYIYQITADGICGPVNRKGTVVLVR